MHAECPVCGGLYATDANAVASHAKACGWWKWDSTRKSIATRCFSNTGNSANAFACFVWVYVVVRRLEWGKIRRTTYNGDG